MSISIEAFNINTGGAKKLLEYMVKYLALHQKGEVCISLKDKSLINYALQFSNVQLLPCDTFSILKRFIFRNRNVLYFGNLPPFRKCKNSLLYIHNEYLTLTISEILKEKMAFSRKLKLFLQSTLIWLFNDNVTNVAVQTKHMADKLSYILKREILILPFFEEEQCPNNDFQKKIDFCYVGLQTLHKNHEKLLSAVRQLIQKEVKFSIAVTIPDNEANTHLIDEVKAINSILPECIINYELANRQKIHEIYSQSRALIFPSKKESLGLPIIEALQHNLTILSSNKEFSYELIDYPITFDQEDVNMIEKVMRDFLDGKFDMIHQSLIITSHIDTVIKLISN
jgi:glycosyltransferase involved in cell wall biosynthesis